VNTFAYHSLLSLALAVSLAGCFGTETGNPPLTAELTFNAHSSAPDRVAIDAPATAFEVEEVWVRLGDVRFLGGDGCAAPPEVLARIGPLTPQDQADANVGRASFDTTERSLCRVEVDLAVGPTVPLNAPAELAEASVVVLGRRPDDVEVVLVYDQPLAIDLEAVGDGVRLEERSAGLLLGFDVAAWFTGLDLSGATVGADGRARIDRDTNPALYSAFEGNLASGVELYRDLEQDGVPDEATPLARGL
jgi:hypothetical protein